MKNGLDEQYIDLLKDILQNGAEKDTRNGKVLSVFGRSIRYKFRDGKFPLLTTKKMAFKTMVTELLWFLRGDTNIKYLVDNGCNIWNGDAYKRYEKYAMANSYGVDILSMDEFIQEIKTDDEFAKKWGDLGKIYGFQWRNWDGEIDQISELIKQLKSNPDSRRMVVNAWAVHDLPNMVLPPCHYGFQVYTRELNNDEKWEQYIKSGLNIEINRTPLELEHMGTPFYPKSLPQRAISLMWNQRSCDFPLGIPMNIASYALLLMIIAKEVNMVPDELIGNLGDCHIYLNQIEGVKEQISREPFELPKLGIDYRDGEYNKDLTDFVPDDFVLFNYQSHPKIYFPLSN